MLFGLKFVHSGVMLLYIFSLVLSANFSGITLPPTVVYSVINIHLDYLSIPPYKPNRSGPKICVVMQHEDMKTVAFQFQESS